MMIYIFLVLCSCSLFAKAPQRITFSHIEGGGIGYSDGYSSLEIFSVVKEFNEAYLFFEEKTHLFNDKKWASNIGIGSRFTKMNSTFGFNFFYDWRESRSLFNRLGCGADVQWSRFFFATNAYFMISPSCTKRDRTWQYPEGYRVTKVVQKCFKNNWDAELGGFIIDDSNFCLYAGVGPYYLQNNFVCSSTDTTWGVKGRITCDIFQWLFFSFFTSYDPLFHIKYQGQLALVIPLARRQPKSSMYAGAARQNIIPLKRSRYYDLKIP